jgi:hypothetical protein
MKLISRLLILISFAFFSESANGQVNPVLFEDISRSLSDSDLVNFNKARIKFQEDAYLDALPQLEKLSNDYPSIPELKYITGICYNYDVNNIARSIHFIRQAESNASTIDGYFFNLAYALEKNDSISTAIEKYKIALAIEEKKSGKTSPLAKEIKYRINRCKKIALYKTKQNPVKISNIGKPINTDAAEYGPLITSNESIMIFTYRGPKSKGGKQKMKGKQSNGNNMELFFEDIFLSRKIGDTMWSEPKPIDNLNTNLHDAAVCLNADGSQLFIYRNLGTGKGDLFLSKLVNSTYSKPIYQAGLNSSEWEGSACFLPNSNKIIFSSERKGGYGGKDLYVAERIKENVWGNIKNLGPVINTKYDEDAPFVTIDGNTLFFSSNNTGSIGGYDVFRSDLKNNAWQTPYNLGPPINTKNDDKFFIVRADGKVGFYSSYKPGGKGEQDIYRIEPGIPGVPIELLEVNGYVSVDGKPVAASVEINSTGKNKKLSVNVKATKQNGLFLTNLPAGDTYELTIKTENFPPQIIDLNTMGIDSFIVMNVFAEFTSPEYDQKLNELNKANETFIVENENLDINDFAARFGQISKDSLAFKIQIGAYKFFENFNYNNVLGFPRIIRQTGDDYITRFFMGHFATYDEAQKLLDKIRAAGVLKDSFIYAEYKGKRKYLNQLISEKIIN